LEFTDHRSTKEIESGCLVRSIEMMFKDAGKSEWGKATSLKTAQKRTCWFFVAESES
jgi:hypothetical protein